MIHDRLPEGAGWRDAIDRIDEALLDLTICEGIGHICIGFSVALFTLGDTHGYIGSAFFAAMKILMLSFARSDRRDIRADAAALAKQKTIQSPSARAQPLRDEGEPPGAVRDTIAPGGAYPYQLDNEPLVPTNVTVFRRVP